MARHLVAGGLALVVLACLAVCPVLAGERVAVCMDGDTLKLTDGRVVRLAGIDTPELGHGGGAEQYYARQSREALRQLVGRNAVTLRSVTTRKGGASSADRYGRTVADVLLPDGTSVNAALVAGGAAFVYPHKELDAAYLRDLLQRQRAAMAERKGFWKRILALPPRSFVGNRHSLRFVPADCPEAQRSKPRNRVPFASLEAAFSAGYAPSRACMFWPEP